jgi:ketosteroid isomerase-like protein
VTPARAASSEPEGATLLRLNEQYLRAVERADRGWFEATLGEDFLCSLPDGGLLDKGAFLAQLGPGPRLTAIEAHDVLVRLLGDVALVHARTTFLNDGRPSRGRYTDVWALRDGRWRAIAAHVTRLG